MTNPSQLVRDRFNEVAPMTDPSRLVRDRIRELRAYHIEQTPCPVIMDANELPYPLPEKLRERLWVIMAGTAFNRYPDMELTHLTAAIAEKERIARNEIVVGNGSDEIIQSLIVTLCDPGAKILTPTPTFVMYEAIAHYLNVDTVPAPLEDDWSLDADKTVALIEREQPRVVFLASPNNPTGVKYPMETVERIIEASPGVVVVDEAYIDYADGPVGLLYRERPNVVILRTLSKACLAAMRLGYLMADERLAAQVNKVRLPYNINAVTQAVATEVLRHWDMLTPLFGKVRREREIIYRSLEEIDGVEPFPSQANFILMRVKTDPGAVFGRLLDEGVRVRWRKGAPRLDDCFRVTVGTTDENTRFLTALLAAL